MRGDRVKLSQVGYDHGIGRSYPESRLGTIFGESRDGACWTVIWDGTKTPSAIHKSFVETVTD